jgi:hypothetical protein
VNVRKHKYSSKPDHLNPNPTLPTPKPKSTGMGNVGVLQHAAKDKQEYK